MDVSTASRIYVYTDYSSVTVTNNSQQWLSFYKADSSWFETRAGATHSFTQSTLLNFRGSSSELSTVDLYFTGGDLPEPTPTPTLRPIENMFNDVSKTSTGVFTSLTSIVNQILDNPIIATFVLVIPVFLLCKWVLFKFLHKRRK